MGPWSVAIVQPLGGQSLHTVDGSLRGSLRDEVHCAYVTPGCRDSVLEKYYCFRESFVLQHSFDSRLRCGYSYKNQCSFIFLLDIWNSLPFPTNKIAENELGEG